MLGFDMRPDLEYDGIVRFILMWLWLIGTFIFCWTVCMPYQFIMRKLSKIKRS